MAAHPLTTRTSQEAQSPHCPSALPVELFSACDAVERDLSLSMNTKMRMRHCVMLRDVPLPAYRTEHVLSLDPASVANQPELLN